MNKYAFFTFLFFLFPYYFLIAEESKISAEKAEEIIDDIYIFGYPLLLMDKTREVMTNVVKVEDNKAPLGQLAHQRQFLNSQEKKKAFLNLDTLSTSAWLDLSEEPFLLYIPNMHGRYYAFSLLDGWSEVFTNPGSHTLEEGNKTFILIGPYWEGEVPSTFQKIQAPTNLAWILGKIYMDGTSQDNHFVNLIQNRVRLTPLSQLGKVYRPALGVKNSNASDSIPVKEQIDRLSGPAFFKNLARLMKDNPPTPEDKAIVDQMKKIGMYPGYDFSIDQTDPVFADKILSVPKRAQEKIRAQQAKATMLSNGWLITTKTGNYGTDYLQRAYIAAIGLGANKPEDAIYLIAYKDAEGKTLNGNNKYVIHLTQDQLPPVHGFRSLTLYDKEFHLYPNPLQRYSIASKNHLIQNKDGSVDIFIQNKEPEKGKIPNWLPAPAGDFILMLRLYLPDASALNGSWTPPSVQRVNF